MTTQDQDPTAQRSATRAPVGKAIKLQFDDSMDVVEGLCENISIGGMFIQVASTRPQGSLVRFELQLDDSTAVRGLGEVVWMRAKTAGPGRTAGIGIKFRFLEQRDRQLIFKMVSQHIKQRLASQQAGRPAPATPPATPVLEPPPPATPAPQGRTAEGQTAESRMPEGRTPEGRTPEVAAELLELEVEPDESPETSAPEGRTPEISVPARRTAEISVPEISVPEIPAPIREPATAASAVLESDAPDLEPPDLEPPDLEPPGREPPVREPDVPELLMVPEEEAAPPASPAELFAGFDAELDALEPSPSPAASVPEAPGPMPEPEEETQSDLTLTPGGGKEISFDELMGADIAPPELGPPATEASNAGAWETVGESAPAPPAEALPEEEFGPPRRRGRTLILLALAVVLAAAAAVHFFREELLGPAVPAGVPTAADLASAEPPAAAAGETPTPETGAPTGGAPDAESAAGAAAADWPTAEPTAAEPAPAGSAEPPAVETVEAALFTRVVDISWSPLPGGQRVVIAADGAVPEGRYRFFRLDGPPPREVIKLFGVGERFARTALAVGGPAVERIRVGYHPGDELHVVLDLADPRARIREIREVGSGLEVDLEIP